MFDPWLTCNSKIVEAMTANMIASSEQREVSRQRRMGARDRGNWETMLHTVLANLALHLPRC